MDAIRRATLSAAEVKTTDIHPIPATMKRAEILEEQVREELCQAVLETQLGLKKLFFEDYDGVLCRTHPQKPDLIKIVLPSSLRARVIRPTIRFLQVTSDGRVFSAEWPEYCSCLIKKP